jgi:O-antigen/teichoic acid export membrane protein
MLGTLQGKEQAALLASIRGISNMANVLMEQIETKVVADWARVQHGAGGNALEAAAARLLKIGMGFWAVGFVVTLVLGREIVALALGQQYAPHWHLLVIGWLGYGVYFLARIYGIKHRALGRNKVEFIGNLYGVVVAFVAGFALISAFAVSGAAWTYVLIAAAIMVAQKNLARK